MKSMTDVNPSFKDCYNQQSKSKTGSSAIDYSNSVKVLCFNAEVCFG
jgi:hypothetical protein